MNQEYSDLLLIFIILILFFLVIYLFLKIKATPPYKKTTQLMFKKI